MNPCDSSLIVTLIIEFFLKGSKDYLIKKKSSLRPRANSSVTTHPMCASLLKGWVILKISLHQSSLDLAHQFAVAFGTWRKNLWCLHTVPNTWAHVFYSSNNDNTLHVSHILFGYNLAFKFQLKSFTQKCRHFLKTAHL